VSEAYHHRDSGRCDLRLADRPGPGHAYEVAVARFFGKVKVNVLPHSGLFCAAIVPP
jgi:hypothetical protein